MNKPTNWAKDTWRKFPRVQQPDWLDDPALKKAEDALEKLPPLVFAGEVSRLRQELSLVEKNKAFIIQGGDCAETFSQCTAAVLRENLKVLLQMSVVLTFAASKRVVKIGRMAGQYAKPRSNNMETFDGKEIPVYRGDMVNKDTPNLEARKANPERILQTYFYSAATLNLLRGYTKGGFASLDNVHKWNKEFIKNTPQGDKYEKLAFEIDKNLSFMKAVGLVKNGALDQVDIYTSHEALILEYEQALTRRDTLSDKVFDCSAHLLWIGDRTRLSDGAHVEFFRGVNNPVGIKLGPDYDLDDFLKIIEIINPNNETGKIVIIPRFGANKVEKLLPKVVQAVNKEGFNLSFCSDPMHGNTFKAGNYKTRDFETILKEITEVNHVLKANNRHLGGIHIETTGLPVTECLGGLQKINQTTLDSNYATTCDPRLNASQSVELAFLLASKLMR
ncbi:MAG: 3-deoxy-7-phosphoheptulonate synthase [SAR324 cluster bacterium]|nr:3-deoxy-7-phosphoheptulonate synthase [SAR324 cluster bacterium]